MATDVQIAGQSREFGCAFYKQNALIKSFEKSANPTAEQSPNTCIQIVGLIEDLLEKGEKLREAIVKAQKVRQKTILSLKYLKEVKEYQEDLARRVERAIVRREQLVDR
jgi:hypothetical protein